MTIEQLGSLGEIIGAAATIATLAYLAVQIRQNNRLVAASIADSSPQKGPSSSVGAQLSECTESAVEKIPLECLILHHLRSAI